MSRDSLCIVIPAYNEEHNIKTVIQEWYPVLSGKGEGSRMIINCSGSTDGTVRILRRMKKEYPALEWMENSENSYGAKVLDLYRAAVETGAAYIFQTDSDGQTDPADFAAFWKRRKKYDVIVGARTERGDGRLRAFVQRVETGMIRHYFHVSVPDANTPFRLMKRFILENYLEIIPAEYSMPNILLTALCRTGGERMAFRRITFRPRRGGKNSMNLRKIARTGLESAGTFRALGRRFARMTPAERAVETIRLLGPLEGTRLLGAELLHNTGREFPEGYFDVSEQKVKSFFRSGKAREYLEFLSVHRARRLMDLDHPVTYCEKLQWLKLHDATPLKTRLTDKYLAKEWIAERVGKEYVVPLLGVWDRPEEIDYDTLPETFALKANHTCKANLFIRDRKDLNPEEINETFHGWLSENHAYKSGELQYYRIRPRVFAEMCLPRYKHGSEEYKFVCENGKVSEIYAFSRFEENGELRNTSAFYDRNWNRLDYVTDTRENITPFEVPAPDTLQEMISIAEKLSEGFAAIRVDLYDVGGKVYVGELTFTPGSGFFEFPSLAYDILMGREITLPAKTPAPV